MTIARAAAVLALALAILLAAWLLVFRGNGGTQYTLLFENAGQLVPDNDVQVGGRRVGSVRSIDLTDDNQAAVRVRVEEPYAPLHEGTQATIRLTSLSGIANRYVALVPGPEGAEELTDGATLTTAATTSAVDLDQLFNTLDPATRADLQGVIKGFRTQLDGKGDDQRECEAGGGAGDRHSIPRGPCDAPARNWRTNWLSESNSASAGPDSTIRPFHSTAMYSATRFADMMSCVITT